MIDSHLYFDIAATTPIHKDVLSLMQHFMGDYYILHQFNGNLNIPNLPATSTPWHRDLTFRHFTSSRPICLTCIWVLDEFNVTNNGLSILPSTQKHDIFPKYLKNLHLTPQKFCMLFKNIQNFS